MYKPNITIEENRIKVFNEMLVRDVQKTFVTSSITASDSTLTVQNITGAAVSGYILIGDIGSEKSEIVQIHAATAPTGTTITLKSGAYPVYNHSTDTPIYFIDYNQVEFSRATTSGGSKTVLSTASITPDSDYTIYNDTTNSSGYCYVRFVNGSTYSEYSDEQAYGTIEKNKIGSLIDLILDTSHTSAPRKTIFNYIRECLSRIEESKTKWNVEEASRNTDNSYSTGTETFTIPTDIKEYKREYIEWIGAEGQKELINIDMQQYENKLVGLPRTTLNGSVLLAATSVILTDSTNFADSGTAYIDGDEFTWTGVTRSTHTLTGVSGITAHDSGSVVLGEEALGTPEYWTIFNQTGRLFPAPDSDNNGKRLIINYWKKLSDIDSENDIIPYAFWTLIVEFVMMRLAQRNREFTEADRFQSSFEKALMGRIMREKLNHTSQMQVGE